MEQCLERIQQEEARFTSALGAALREHSSSAAAFWLGAAAACTVWVLLVGAAAAVFLTWRDRQHRERRLQGAAKLAAASDEELRAMLADVLPAWAASPDAARVEWMNALTAQLWPHIEAAGSKLLMDKDNPLTPGTPLLEGLLNATTFWRPSVLMGANIGVQGVALGQAPPRVTGIKTFPQPEGGPATSKQVLLECSFVWASRMEIRLLITLLGTQRANAALKALLSKASRVKVGVSNMVVRGTVRIAVKPLLDELPVAGGVKVSLMGKPDFHYKVSTIGGNPYLVPGVEQFVTSFVENNVLKPFTFPDGFTYDLVTGSTAAVEKPEGLLEVTVVEATNVPRMDWYGLADPYCKLWVKSSRKLRTAVCKRTLSPAWNERFTFVVHSLEHQNLVLELYDSDRLSSDDLAGHVTVPLTSLDLTPGAVNDLWLPCPRPQSSRDKDDSTGHHTVYPASHQADAPAITKMEVDRARVVQPTPASKASERWKNAAALARGASAELAAAAPTAPAAVGQQQQQPKKAGMARQASSAGSGGSGGSGRAPERVTSGMGSEPSLNMTFSGLMQLAASPLEVLRAKRCMLHIQATYLPLSEQERAAMAREAGRQQRGEEGAARTPRAGSHLEPSASASARVDDLMHSGVLTVYVDRASGLSGSSKKGFTRNITARVCVGDLHKGTEHSQVPFRHRKNPVFDETIEVLVDGRTARQAQQAVVVEIYEEHLVRRASFKGCVRIPLKQVIGRRRMQGTWPLEDGRQGTLTLELSWMGTLMM